MIRAAIVSLSAALLGPAASAAELPRYDPVAYCQQLLDRTGQQSEFLLRSCLQLEQQSYDHLKVQASTLPEAVLEHCMRTNETVDMSSYWMLRNCVDLELQSKAANDEFVFKP